MRKNTQEKQTRGNSFNIQTRQSETGFASENNFKSISTYITDFLERLLVYYLVKPSIGNFNINKLFREIYNKTNTYKI